MTSAYSVSRFNLSSTLKIESDLPRLSRPHLWYGEADPMNGPMNGIVGLRRLPPLLPPRPEGHRRGAREAPAGKGTRAVASYDEDTTSHGRGGGAGRAARRPAASPPPRSTSPPPTPPTSTRPTPPPSTPRSVSTTPAHGLRHGRARCAPASARCGPRSDAAPADAGGAVRHPHRAAGRRRRARGRRRARRPSSSPRATRARPCSPSRSAAASATAEFLERWRVPGDAASRQWEERFGEHAYVPLGGGRAHRARSSRPASPAPALDAR